MYYLNQSLELLLAVTFDDPNLSLENATAMEVDYRDPGGVTGSWTGSRNDDNIVQADVPAGVLNKLGNWTVWTKVTFNTLIYYGTPVIVTISNQGT